jgi:hypothetical protein
MTRFVFPADPTGHVEDQGTGRICGAERHGPQMTMSLRGIDHDEGTHADA